MFFDDFKIMDIITIFGVILGALTLYFTLKLQSTPIIKGFIIHEFKDPVYFFAKGIRIKIRICNYGSKTAYNIKFNFLDGNKKVLELQDIVKKIKEEDRLLSEDYIFKLNQFNFMAKCLNEKIECNLEKRNKLKTPKYKHLFDKFILSPQYNELESLKKDIEYYNNMILKTFGTLDQEKIKWIKNDFSNLYQHLTHPLNIFFESEISLEPEKIQTFEIYQDKKSIHYYGGNEWNFEQIKYLSVSYNEAFKKNHLDNLIKYIRSKIDKSYNGKTNKIIELKSYDNHSHTIEELNELRKNKTLTADLFFNNDIYKIWLSNLSYNNRSYMNNLRLKYGSDMYHYIDHYSNIKDVNFKKDYFELLKLIMHNNLFLDTIREDAEVVVDGENNFHGRRIRV